MESLNFQIYGDFESILVPEDNGKQYLKESYTNKYPKRIACSYGYRLVCVNGKFSSPFKSYLGENAVCNFINSMIEESKYCSDMIKKYFNTKLVMTEKNNGDFKNSIKCWIFGSGYVDNDVKVRDDCHVTGKCRRSEHRDCNINLKLNHEIPVVFHNLRTMIHILLCKN